MGRGVVGRARCSARVSVPGAWGSVCALRGTLCVLAAGARDAWGQGLVCAQGGARVG